MQSVATADFRGTRVPFKNLMDCLEGGHPTPDFLDLFPTITGEIAVQAREEAKESLLARIVWGFCWTSASPWISASCSLSIKRSLGHRRPRA